MRPGRKFRHDSAVDSVHIDLRVNDIGKHLFSVPYNSGGSFIAGALNRQYIYMSVHVSVSFLLKIQRDFLPVPCSDGFGKYFSHRIHIQVRTYKRR